MNKTGIVLFVALAIYGQLLNNGLARKKIEVARPSTAVAHTPFYIFAGQSNLGYASVSSQHATNHLESGDSGYYAAVANAKIFNIRNPVTAWENFHPGLNTAINDYPYPDGLSIAASFVKKLNEANPSEEVWIFQEGHGGTSLYDQWSSRGLYGNLVSGAFYTKLSQSIAAAAAAGRQLEFKGIIWMEGETSSQKAESAKAYRQQMDTFFNNMYTKLQQYFIENKMSTPIVRSTLVGQINYPGASYREMVRKSQADYCQIPSNKAIIIKTDSIPLQGDNLHYTAQGLITLGSKFYYALHGTLSPSKYDADAMAYFSAAGIKEEKTKKNINQLVTDLKNAGVWLPADAIYLLTNKNALANSFNLKNTSTYQLSFNGPYIHTAGGLKGDGLSTFTNTGWLPGANIGQNISVGFYDKTGEFDPKYAAGCTDGLAIVYLYPSAGSCEPNKNSGEGGIGDKTSSISICTGDRRGMLSVSRTSATHEEVTLRGFKIGENNQTTTAPALTQPFYLHALNNKGTPSSFSARLIPYLRLGKSLTTKQQKMESDAVERFLMNMDLL